MSTLEKRCSGCGERKPHSEYNRNRAKSDGLQTRCRACTRQKHRDHYAVNAERERERIYANQRSNPKKHRARREVMKALWRGDLVRQPCDGCGSTERIEGHHEDYDKPLEVRWMCRRCHAAEHRDDSRGHEEKHRLRAMAEEAPLPDRWRRAAIETVCDTLTRRHKVERTGAWVRIEGHAFTGGQARRLAALYEEEASCE